MVNAAKKSVETRMLTALDPATFHRTEVALMKLSDVIASTYFTTQMRSEAQLEALG